MSQSRGSEEHSANAALVLEGFEAWDRGDFEKWLTVLHPEVKFHTAGVFPDLEREYRGRAEVKELWRAMHTPWTELRTDVETIEEHGDWVLYVFRFRAVGIESGIEVDLRYSGAIRIQDGLQIEIHAQRTLEEAREVVRGRQ